jgi:hypothetical protein
VTPPDQAEMVWAIKGTDTVKTKVNIVKDLRTQFESRSGKIIDAKNP